MATASAVVTLSEEDTNKRSGSPTSERSQASADDPDSLDLTGPNPTRDALADGIVSLLSPTLKTLDEGVLSTKRSQEELSEQIALLTDQLKLISAEQLCPIDLDGYVNRLGTIKGKINVISSVLHAAQERLNKVHDQAVKEASKRKPLLESSPVTSPGAVLSPDPEQAIQNSSSSPRAQAQFQSQSQSTPGSGSGSGSGSPSFSEIATPHKDPAPNPKPNPKPKPTEENDNNVDSENNDKAAADENQGIKSDGGGALGGN